VLLQVFGGFDVNSAQVETEGIRHVSPADIEHAHALGGTIKPVILADWTTGLTACSAPAFVPTSHLLASVDGSENAIVLAGRHGRILLRGPGAGPEVTAATVMDDLHEAARPSSSADFGALKPANPAAPETAWFIRLSSDQLPELVDIADLLASNGVFLRRSHSRAGATSLSALTLSCTRARVEAALRACRAAAGCDVALFRALEG